jgi:hypothetical protein
MNQKVSFVLQERRFFSLQPVAETLPTSGIRMSRDEQPYFPAAYQ